MQKQITKKKKKEKSYLNVAGRSEAKERKQIS